MITAIVIIESVSVFVAMVRWAKRYNSDAYKYKGSPDADEACLGHLVLGIVPLIGLSYMIGAWLAARDGARKQCQQETIEQVQDDVRKLVGP